MNQNTFVCPGMIVKLPYKLGDSVVYAHCVVVQVFRYTVDMENLKTRNIFPVDISSLRQHGELIGYSYKEKWND
ncbi:hypothetical protein EPNKCIFM_00158 [Klebsiella phage KP13-16]|nr:hypothetical protein EPNKCIFM_00158 [Klebsiella phage KP13-16]